MKDEYTFDNKELLKQKIRNLLHFREKKQDMVSFEGKFADFNEAQKVCGGYASNIIFDKVKKASLVVKEGKASYERDGYLFYEQDYYLQLIVILYEIYLNQRRLNIVDFGGSLGSTYFQNITRVSQYIDRLSWNVIEQKHFVDWGRLNLENDVLKFYYSLEEITDYNCVLFGSSLQYIANYEDYLRQISLVKCKYIIIDRVPVSNESWVSIEYVHEPIYEASYPVFIFDENKIIALLAKLGYTLDMSWIKDSGEVWQIGSKLMRPKSFLFIYNGVG